MAYTPPLNGGRINATISGNTAGAGSLVSTGTLTFAGGNNITLSQVGNAITISGANAPNGSFNFSAGSTSANLASIVFANANSLSFGLNAGTITGSFSQTNQTLAMYGVGNTTQNTSGTFDARSLSFNGLGGLSAGYSNGSVQLSAPGLSSLSATGALSISNNGSTVNIGVPAVSFGISNIGNTSGTSGTASNQIVFAGGNNITLSQATGAGGNTLTISAGGGNVNFSAGTTSANLASVTFGNSNNMSFGLNAGTITGSFSQSVQTQGIQALSAGTQIGNSGTIQFVNAAGLSWGLSNSNQLTGVVGAVRVITAGGSSMSDVKTLEFDNANGITFGANTGVGIGTITASHNGITSQSVQTQNVHNVTLAGNTAGALAQISTGTLTLAGGNNITLSQAGNAITISGGGGGGGIALVGGGTTYTSGSVNFNASGGLTIASAAGQSLNFSVPQTSLFSATGAISISTNGNTISIGAPAMFNAGISNVGNTSGTSGQNTNGLVLAGGNNITLSQSTNSAGATVTISGGAGGGGGGVAFANSQTTYSSGTANFNASGALTIASTTGQSFNFSVPQTSSLIGVSGITLSTTGGTISIGMNPVQIPTTLSRYEYPEGFFTSLGLMGQGSLSINHAYIPFNVSGSALKIGGSLSAMTNTSATVASINLSLWMGIYTLNGSTLSLASSGSANNGFQWSQSASSSANTSVNSMRQLTVPMNVNMTPGEYWVAAVLSSATTYTSIAYSVFGNNLVNGAATGAILTPIGSNTSAGRDVMLNQGIYSANTSAGPSSIPGSAVNNYSASYPQRANFYYVILNAVY
jgi:hypothetical protein